MRIVSKGIITKPLNDKNFNSNAFPCIEKLPSGRWLGAFKAAEKKGDCDFVHAVMTWSDDEGKTWISPFEPVKLPDINNVPGQSCILYFLSLGAKRVLMLVNWIDSSDLSKPYYDPENSSLKDTRIFFCFSEDDGETWSTPELMNTDPVRDPTPLTGAPFMLKNGTIVCQFEINKHNWDRSDWVHKSAMIFSEDGGRTWKNFVKVTEVPDMFYWDQHPNVMADGISIVDFFWTLDGKKQQYQNIHARESLDGGKTWGDIWDTGTYGQPGQPVDLGDGRIATIDEAPRRGGSGRVRSKALGLAFGLGPAFAVVGALFAQLLLDGKLYEFQLPQWLVFDSYRYNYAILFGTSAVSMSLSTLLVHLYRIPLPKVDVEREPFKIAVLGGFKSLISNRVLLIACCAYLLVYCGNMVQNNMNIFTMESVGIAPEGLVGYQLALRFSFKILAGFLLGWLLIRTNPKVPLLVTVGLQIAGVLWVLLVPGYWFMLAFGFMGAGELFGVYYINYPVCCSPKSQVRRNIAFLSLISSMVGLSPILYGWISDTWNLRASFWTALAIMVFTTALVIIKLPALPKPRPEDLSEADLAEDV